MWVVVAAAGLVIALSVAFWQRIVTWANLTVAAWVGDLLGQDLKEAFLLLVAATDRVAVLAQRTVKELGERLLSVRLLFRQIQGGTAHEKVVQAEIQKADGQIEKREIAEIVPWHELPDDVREKFIRRQAAQVEMELKIRE